MAKLRQGILGGITGSIGNVVGSSWKGIPVLKQKALSVSNPKTAGQVEQRAKMSSIVLLTKLILSGIIKPLWDRFAVQMSGYNAFVRANVSCFTAGVFTAFSTFVISIGKIGVTEIQTLAGTSAQQTATIGWVNDGGVGFKLATDLAYIIIYNETTDEFVFKSGDSIRTGIALSADFSVNLNINDILHGYLAFRRADGTMVSNTGYKTFTVTA